MTPLSVATRLPGFLAHLPTSLLKIQKKIWLTMDYSLSKILPAGILACLILAGIPVVAAADGLGALPAGDSNITVRTFPAGASVYLNGEFRGTTPLKIENLEPGQYRIEISLSGYRNETFTRTLIPGSMHEIGINRFEPLSAPLAPTGSGSIAVDSNPGGATVRLDDFPVGLTPAGRAALILNEVPAGTHTVTVELQGFPPFTRNVTVIKNQVVKVDAEFESRSPAATSTPVASIPVTSTPKPVPLSLLTVVAAAGLAGLVAVFCRRS